MSLFGTGSKPPSAPDPATTAAAAASANKATAVTQYGLDATNQVTPQGNLTYKQIGTWPDGTPRFEATTSYSPEQQRLYDTSTALQGQLGDIGTRQASAVADTLAKPFTIGNADTEARLFSLGKSQLEPGFTADQSALESKLVASGIRRGSDQWTRAEQEFSDNRDRAYNDLLLRGRQTADTESLAERNQPLTELSALLSGSQPQSPSFTGTPQPGVAGVDLAGLINSGYQNQLAAYNQQQANNPLNSLFKLGTTALGAWAGA